jgi:hypothetical protein
VRIAGTLEKRISTRKQNTQPGLPTLLSKVDAGAAHPGKSTLRGKSNVMAHYISRDSGAQIDLDPPRIWLRNVGCRISSHLTWDLMENLVSIDQGSSGSWLMQRAISGLEKVFSTSQPRSLLRWQIEPFSSLDLDYLALNINVTSDTLKYPIRSSNSTLDIKPWLDTITPNELSLR